MLIRPSRPFAVSFSVLRYRLCASAQTLLRGLVERLWNEAVPETGKGRSHGAGR
jgi:hypothetical protein